MELAREYDVVSRICDPQAHLIRKGISFVLFILFYHIILYYIILYYIILY